MILNFTIVNIPENINNKINLTDCRILPMFWLDSNCVCLLLSCLYAFLGIKHRMSLWLLGHACSHLKFTNSIWSEEVNPLFYCKLKADLPPTVHMRNKEGGMTWDGTWSEIWYPPADQTGTEGCHPAGAETQADIKMSAHNSETSAEQQERSPRKHLTVTVTNYIRKKGETGTSLWLLW